LNHKDGEQTAFFFPEMLKKADALSYELAHIQGKLAVANATNTVEYMGSVISLSHAIRILQELKGRISWVKALPCLATEKVSTSDRDWDELTDKYITKASTLICSLPEAKRAELADSLQEEFDTLNGAVELINQTVTLSV
jgi:hypothetical protein